MADHCLQLLDHDAAVREVAQAYERIKTHQPLLLLLMHADDQAPPPSPTMQLAQSLLGEALRALNVALSAMKQHQPPPPAALRIKAEPQLSSTSPANSGGGGGGSSAAGCQQARRARKRRRNEEDKSWVNMTAVPHEDGYQWRKYGEKKIHGTQFTRSYFRCTYKDDKACLATKQIQQKDYGEAPMFQVTYNNDHTCSSCTTIREDTSDDNVSLASLLLATDPDDGGRTRIIKQEAQAPAPLPPLTAQVFSDDQAPPPPSSSHEAAAAAFPTSNNVSCCDELFDLYVRQATMEPLGDDDDYSFSDPDLLLLYDSFKYY